MRSLRLQQFKVIALLFAGYGALYFCRADLSVGSPLIIDELGRHGIGHDEAVKRIGDVASIGVFAYAWESCS
jgi:sugar phosphate permease